MGLVSILGPERFNVTRSSDRIPKEGVPARELHNRIMSDRLLSEQGAARVAQHSDESRRFGLMLWSTDCRTRINQEISNRTYVIHVIVHETTSSISSSFFQPTERHVPFSVLLT